MNIRSGGYVDYSIGKKKRQEYCEVCGISDHSTRIYTVKINTGHKNVKRKLCKDHMEEELNEELQEESSVKS